MVATFTVLTISYILGAIAWFLFYYIEWADNVEERKHFANQMLAAPLWPFALFRNLLFLIGQVKEDAKG